MSKVCSCCGRTQPENIASSDGRTSHVMCVNCAEYFSMLWDGKADMTAIQERKLPVFMMTVGRRLVACNKRAETALRKPSSLMEGLLCGEFLGCENSHLPEGCGLTPHCESCTIRRALSITADTGRPQQRVMAFLKISREGVPENTTLMVTTTRTGDLIELELSGL